jgi:predicted ribosomally synthesized peptide with SipW-like signal peptide
MKKIMPLAASIILILVAGIFVSAGTMALFSDTEKVSVRDINAGTLDLKVDGFDDPLAQVDISDMKPGDTQWIHWTLKNTGTIAGKVSVEFSAITNQEGLNTEPELVAEAKPFTAYGPRTTLGDPINGELGEYLITALQKSKFDAFFVFDSTGPPDTTGPRALNGVGGKTYDMGVTLGQNAEQAIWISFRLASDLKASKGGYVYEIDDNVIQGDAVYFDIIFHLDQA